MIKFYKKMNMSSETEQLRKLLSGEQSVYIKNGTYRLPNIIAIPAMILGGLATVAFFSVFFVLLSIPVAILTYKGWKFMRKAGQQQTEDNVLDAEYTVIDDKEKK